jgi:hypothetical protein
MVGPKGDLCTVVNKSKGKQRFYSLHMPVVLTGEMKIVDQISYIPGGGGNYW